MRLVHIFIAMFGALGGAAPVSSGIPANAITDPATGQAITDPADNQYITEP